MLLRVPNRLHPTTFIDAYLLCRARLALVALIDDLPLSAASRACALQLLYHTGTDLMILDLQKRSNDRALKMRTSNIATIYSMTNMV